MTRTWSCEQAETFYIEAVRGFMEPDPEKEIQLREWIRSESPDGIFREESDPVIGVVYWDMNQSA